MKLLQRILLDNKNEILEGSYPVGTMFIIPTTGDKYVTVMNNNDDRTTNNTTLNKMILEGIVVQDAPGASTETGATIASKLYAEADTNNFDDASVTKLASLNLPTDDEIKRQYEANADTNAFTNIEQAKLALLGGPLSDLDVKAAYENNPNSNEFNDAEKAKLATLTKLTEVEIRDLYELNPDRNAFTDALMTKLVGITGMTNFEVKTAYEGNMDTNAFTDALRAKLRGIQDGALKLTPLQIKTMYESLADTNEFNNAEKLIVAGAIQNIEKASPSGVATLDVNGKVPLSQLSSTLITDIVPVPDIAAMLVHTPQKIGTFFILANESKTYVHTSGAGTNIADYLEVLSPHGVDSINGMVGVVDVTTGEVPESTDKNYVTDTQKAALPNMVTKDDAVHFEKTITVGDGSVDKEAELRLLSKDGITEALRLGRTDPASNTVYAEAIADFVFKIPTGSQLLLDNGNGIEAPIATKPHHTTGTIFPPNPIEGDQFTLNGTNRSYRYNGALWTSSSHKYIITVGMNYDTDIPLPLDGDSFARIDNGTEIESGIYVGGSWIIGGGSSGSPIGEVIMYPKVTPPDGYLLCDGSVIPASCPELILLIGTNVPDMTNLFVRGTKTPSEIDFSAKQDTTRLPRNPYVGLAQHGGVHLHNLGSVNGHDHTLRTNKITSGGITNNSVANFEPGNWAVQFRDNAAQSNGSTGINGGHTHNCGTSASHTHNVVISVGGDPETAPKHIKMAYMIKGR